MGQGVPVQPPGGLGLVQDDLPLGHDTPEAVHVQVKGGVVILDRVEPFSHLRGDGKLLLDLPNQGLLRGLSGLDFSAGKLLLALVVPVPSGRGKDLGGVVQIVADHSGDNVDGFHRRTSFI